MSKEACSFDVFHKDVSDALSGTSGDSLTFVVLGASGDLAKKKIYPTLFNLHKDNFFPEKTNIVGYARSDLGRDAFLEKIKPFLKTKDAEEEKQLESFLAMLSYCQGPYDQVSGFQKLDQFCIDWESQSSSKHNNRIFYLALPPSVFQSVTSCIKEGAWGKKGWSRVIIEKPFGHDSESSQVLSDHLSSIYKEEDMYRIDHYLGKEMVQNMMILRFGNRIYQPIWNRDNIDTIKITFKEPFGTYGRGGYFDNFGIIRDILQNHLLQVLCMVAMEKPVSLDAADLRDEKVKVLKAIPPIELSDSVLGQYVASNREGIEDSKYGYKDDETVPKDSVTPTFAQTVLFIKNERWDGVPFILKAGKALDERKCEVRIQFREVPGNIFSETPQRNELVIRLQPDEAVYMKMNIKKPGLYTKPLCAELDVTYKDRFDGKRLPDAYERLILDVMRGVQGSFVRSDELKEAWRIFTPLLHKIEKEKIEPIDYAHGGRGPAEADAFAEKLGYGFHKGGYKWKKPESK